MPHAHGRGAAPAVPVHTRRQLATAAVGLAVVTVAAMVALRPGNGSGRPDVRQFGAAATQYDATVVAVDPAGCAARPSDGACTLVTFELLAGPDEGTTAGLEFEASPSTPEFDEGEKVVLSHSPEAEPGFEYQFADRQRKPALFWLAVAFAVAVVVLGRLRGLAALVGLAGSILVLLRFALPAIIDGRDPVLVAVVAAAAISFLALYLAHGVGPMTTVALLGTLASLAFTAVLAVLFVNLARFSGFASEEAIFVQAAGARLDLQGLMLAGVVIGALGALDDVTVTQSSAVWELRAADPVMSRPRLVAAGLRIGRDHVASTVNTLVLAYVGASMPLMVLFVLAGQPLADVANGEVVATEIVRTLVGSLGLVASVPLTTWLAARVATAASTAPPS